MMATDVTRFAFSRNGPTTPAMSRISSVRGKIASALECSDCAAPFSTRRQRSPRRAHSLANRSPTGPAPTINTSVSSSVVSTCPSSMRIRYSWPRINGERGALHDPMMEPKRVGQLLRIADDAHGPDTIVVEVEGDGREDSATLDVEHRQLTVQMNQPLRDTVVEL